MPFQLHNKMEQEGSAALPTLIKYRNCMWDQSWFKTSLGPKQKYIRGSTYV